jgi:hypothetical protein
MENVNIDKSMQRAKSGGTFNFFQTKFLGFEKDIYTFELNFSSKALIPLKPFKEG